jgi:hypothetical protein
VFRSWRSAFRDTCLKSENLNCREIRHVNPRRWQTKDLATVTVVTLLVQDTRNALHVIRGMQYVVCSSTQCCSVHFLSTVLNSKYLQYLIFLHSTAAFQAPFKTFWTQCRDQYFWCLNATSLYDAPCTKEPHVAVSIAASYTGPGVRGPCSNACVV